MFSNSDAAIGVVSAVRRLRCPVSWCASVLAILGLVSCDRVSSLDRFGGTVVTVALRDPKPDPNTTTDRDALLQRLLETPNVSDARVTGDDELTLRLPSGVKTEDVLGPALSAHEQLARFEFRLALDAHRWNAPGYSRQTLLTPPGPADLDSCVWRRNGVCNRPNESYSCDSDTDWTDCDGTQGVPLLIRPTPLAIGSQIIAVTNGPERYELQFNPGADQALRAAANQHHAERLAVFLDGAPAFINPFVNLLSKSGVTLPHKEAPWQSALTSFVESLPPARFTVRRESTVPAPDTDGVGSKYPW